jgi:hypothetical protein
MLVASMRASYPLLPVALVAVVLVSSVALAADPDPAQASFDRGVADMDAGRFDKACPAVEESYNLDPRLGTLFTLAECEAKWGRLATAVQRYEAYLAAYAALPADKKLKQGDREQVSRAARAALLPSVPELTLTLPPASPAGTRVTRDGAPVAEAALGAPMRVDPGEHVLTVQAPGGPVLERRVRLAKGEKKAILLDVKEAAAPAAALAVAPVATPPPPEQGPSGRRVGAFVAGGAGVAGVVLGAVTGGLALAKKSTVDANCGSGIHASDPTACNGTGLAAANSLKTLGLVSTVGLAVGAAGLGVGVVLFATEPKATAMHTGSAPWMGVELLPAGTSGAAARMTGAW